MTLEMTAKHEHVVEISYKPVDVSVACPAELAGGEDFVCSVENAAIAAVKDPAAVLASVRLPLGGTFGATLRDGLMDSYEGFGRLAQKTFGRRSFFLELEAGEHSVIWPVDFAIATAVAEIIEVPEFGPSVPLDIPLMNASTNWQDCRWLDSLPALGLYKIKDPLQGIVELCTPIDGSDRLLYSMEEVGEFEIQPGRMTIISDHSSTPSTTFKVGKKATALQFLVMPLLNNIDVFSEVAEITVRGEHISKGNAIGHVDTDLYRKVLRYPGDLDNWIPVAGGAGYNSFRQNWTTTPAFTTDTGTFNVVTVAFGKEIDVDTVTVSTIGRHPALGIIAVSAR